MLPGLSANTHFFDAVIEDGLGSAARCIALVVTRENHMAVSTAPDTAHGVLGAPLTTK